MDRMNADMSLRCGHVESFRNLPKLSDPPGQPLHHFWVALPVEPLFGACPRSSEQSSRPAASMRLRNYALGTSCYLLEMLPRTLLQKTTSSVGGWGEPRRAMRLEYGSAAHPRSLATSARRL